MELNDKIKKENPFRAPDGYFDSLADRTMDAIRKDGSSNETVKPRIISMKPFLSLAAAILGFAVLAAVTVRLVTADRSAGGYEPGTSLYADLAFEELDAYMLENELFVTEPVAGTMPEEEISSEAIIEYLMTEDIDLNDIYELL